MKTIYMIRGGRYFDFNIKKCTIGGIQTYITGLCEVAKELGMDCCVYQTYTSDDKLTIGNTTIIQSKVSQKKKEKKKIAVSLKKCLSKFDKDNDILIFTSDTRIQKNFVKRSIAIQHGICWDIPRHKDKSPLFNSIYTFSRSREAFKTLERLRKVKNIVCVDYNFVNWYRAVSAYEAVNLKVIPNYTKIADRNEKPKDKINIIFARRFEIYRGTRLFVDAVSRILKVYPNVYVTVAGSGPDEKYIKDKLSIFKERVAFITYTSEESLKVHADKHIAVIPTVGSEGTSLSLLEAMSAQCAVVCTNVGGMTNIVIDGYNGLMISPKENELYDALTRLIEDEKLRTRLSERAYETVKEGFSYEKWKDSWKEVFLKVLS